ncbi:hypothetical protein D3C75_1302250 [compost metagenome]
MQLVAALFELDQVIGMLGALAKLFTLGFQLLLRLLETRLQGGVGFFLLCQLLGLLLALAKLLTQFSEFVSQLLKLSG